jgi:hypothetical protein
MFRNAFLLAVTAGAALTASNLKAAAGSPYFAPEPPSVTGAPFSAVMQTQSTTAFADGNRIVRTNTVRYFRDSQGRTRTERSATDDRSSAGKTVTINDPVSGLRSILYPQAKLAMVSPIRVGVTSSETPEAAADLNSPFALLGFGMGIGANPSTEASASETSLGQRVIQDVSAVGTRVVRTIPAGVLGNEKPITSTLDSWFSPDLGLPVQITQRSSIGGEVTLTLKQIARAEPDSALFMPPADYRRHDIRLPVLATSAASAEAH